MVEASTLASMSADSRVQLFSISKPVTPKTIEPWLRIHPAYEALEQSGLAKLFTELLREVLSSMPFDVTAFLREKLADSSPVAASQERYLATHAVRAKDSRIALATYVAETRVMDLFVEMIEAAVTDFESMVEVSDPRAWVKQYLSRL
jgi:hypothetical protein